MEIWKKKNKQIAEKCKKISELNFESEDKYGKLISQFNSKRISLQRSFMRDGAFIAEIFCFALKHYRSRRNPRLRNNINSPVVVLVFDRLEDASTERSINREHGCTSVYTSRNVTVGSVLLGGSFSLSIPTKTRECIRRQSLLQRHGSFLS